MEKIQERANELLQERERVVTRLNEINGALQELERQAKELNETEVAEDVKE